ncbi:MAG: hypothetical protein Q9167_004057 [Letrouitia subvulpina]
MIGNARTYEARYRLVQGQTPCPDFDRKFFVTPLLSAYMDDNGYVEELENMTLEQARESSKNPLSSEPDDGPIVAWKWAYGGWYANCYIFAENWFFRQRAYVMWDIDRLALWGLFQSCRADVSEAIGRAYELSSTAEEEQRKSYEARSEIYKNGGRGWWRLALNHTKFCEIQENVLETELEALVAREKLDEFVEDRDLLIEIKQPAIDFQHRSCTCDAAGSSLPQKLPVFHPTATRRPHAPGLRSTTGRHSPTVYFIWKSHRGYASLLTSFPSHNRYLYIMRRSERAYSMLLVKVFLKWAGAALLAIGVSWQVPYRTWSTEQIVRRLDNIHGTIEELMSIAGTPGLAIGVLHEGQAIYRANFGYRDVARQSVPNSDTVFHIGSMSKSMIARAFALLVEDGQVGWETKLHELVPEYAEKSGTEAKLKELKTDADLTDLLALRLGVTLRNQYWTQMYQKMLLDKKLTATVLADLDPLIGFWERMFYNNWAYGLAGEILERVKGETAGQYLKRTIFTKLGMENTTFGIPSDANYVVSYMTMTDGTPYQVPPPSLNDGDLIEHQESTKSTSTPSSSFARLLDVWSDHIPVAKGSTYGLGWVLTNLPGQGGLVGVNAYPVHLGTAGMPTIGQGVAQGLRRMIYHYGAMIGAQSSVYLLPDTQTAIVVLSNSLGLSESPDWIGQLLVEELLDTPAQQRTDFISYAKKVRAAALAIHPATQRTLEAERVPNTPAKPPDAYVGRYVNHLGIFHLDVAVDPAGGRDGELGLSLIVQGFPEVCYRLYHYHHDIFVWDCDRDAESKKCMFPQAQIGWHRIKFEADEDGSFGD